MGKHALEWVQLLVVVGTLCGALGAVSSGCASQQHSRGAYEETIERPAQPLSEEESLSDRIGQMGIVLLVVGVTLVPILLWLIVF